MENEERLYYLWQQYANNNASREELAELKAMLDDPALEKKASGWLLQQLEQIQTGRGYSEKRLNSVLQAIRQQRSSSKPVQQVHFIRRYWWAAAILLFIAGSTVFLFTNKKNAMTTSVAARRFKNDVAPGGNKATLTLGNGAVIVLDSAHIGTIAANGKMIAKKIDSGLLAYDVNGTSKEVTYNMVNTPIGGQYQLILPDSTKVWLNAASSIRFPTVFTGSERRVEVTGEAYFQVRHMKAQSFVVQAGNQAIEDIGTGFNVNTYPDEGSIRTTLVEGAIKVNGELLKPDQQAVTATDGKTLLRNDIIVSDVIAWKNGQFRFKGADIEDLMRQAARWYNVQVEYKGKVNETFSGGISRKVNLSELLQILELTGTVEFEINGNKITVIPK